MAGSIEEFQRAKAQTDKDKRAIAEQLIQLSTSLGVNLSQAVMKTILSLSLIAIINTEIQSRSKNV